MDPTQQRWRGMLQILMGLGLTFLFFYMMAPFMIALVLGAVVAAICYPMYARLRKKLPRSLAAVLVTLGVAVGLLGPIVTVLYVGIFRVKEVIGQLSVLKDNHPMEAIVNHPVILKLVNGVSKTFPVDREWLQAQAMSVLGTVLEWTSTIIGSLLKGMPALLMGFAVVLLSLFFFLVDGNKFLRFLNRLSPLKHERSEELFLSFEESCRGVVLGLLLSALTQAIIMVVFWMICGLPEGFLVFFLTMIFGLVPIIGTGPIWIGAVIYLGAQHHLVSAVAMLVGGIAVSGADNVVRAWVMKGHGEMHPLLALVSVFGAVNLVGPMGIFLGPIIAAVFVAFLKIVSSEIDRDKPSVIMPTDTSR